MSKWLVTVSIRLKQRNLLAFGCYQAHTRPFEPSLQAGAGRTSHEGRRAWVFSRSPRAVALGDGAGAGGEVCPSGETARGGARRAELDSVAAKDPSSADVFIGALYIRGVQLLVVSAKYTAPSPLNDKVAKKEYRDVYIDLNIASVRNEGVHRGYGYGRAEGEAGRRSSVRHLRAGGEAHSVRRRLEEAELVGRRVHEGFRDG